MIVEGSTEVDEVIWYSREVRDIVAPAKRPEFRISKMMGIVAAVRRRKFAGTRAWTLHRC
jgi:hypothetical protein